jgi:hypothetical protein
MKNCRLGADPNQSTSARSKLNFDAASTTPLLQAVLGFPSLGFSETARENNSFISVCRDCSVGLK